MKSYDFSFSGQIFPIQGEENVYNNTFVKITMIDTGIKYLKYYIDTTTDSEDVNKDKHIIHETTTFLLLSTGNSAHTLSEIISFISYYKNKCCTNMIAISEYVPRILPLLFDLIKIFIPLEQIIILYEKNIYKFDMLITYRNHHFNQTDNWDNINFNKCNNQLQFNNIQYIKHNFSINTLFLFDKVEEIYNIHKNHFCLYDNVMLIKTSNDTLSSSINRAMDVPNDNIKNILINNNIKYLSISDFKNIYEYICVLYHAKNVIVSYGGPCCTNRFFCNHNSNVVVIAHLHYRYEYHNENQMYWHVRHSHLYPVKKQHFLLDFDNNINENNINNILQLLQ